MARLKRRFHTRFRLTAMNKGRMLLRQRHGAVFLFFLLFILSQTWIYMDAFLPSAKKQSTVASRFERASQHEATTAHTSTPLQSSASKDDYGISALADDNNLLEAPQLKEGMSVFRLRSHRYVVGTDLTHDTRATGIPYYNEHSNPTDRRLNAALVHRHALTRSAESVQTPRRRRLREGAIMDGFPPPGVAHGLVGVIQEVFQGMGALHAMTLPAGTPMHVGDRTSVLTAPRDTGPASYTCSRTAVLFPTDHFVSTFCSFENVRLDSHRWTPEHSQHIKLGHNQKGTRPQARHAKSSPAPLLSAVPEAALQRLHCQSPKFVCTQLVELFGFGGRSDKDAPLNHRVGRVNSTVPASLHVESVESSGTGFVDGLEFVPSQEEEELMALVNVTSRIAGEKRKHKSKQLADAVLNRTSLPKWLATDLARVYESSLNMAGSMKGKWRVNWGDPYPRFDRPVLHDSAGTYRSWPNVYTMGVLHRANSLHASPDGTSGVCTRWIEHPVVFLQQQHLGRYWHVIHDMFVTAFSAIDSLGLDGRRKSGSSRVDLHVEVGGTQDKDISMWKFQLDSSRLRRGSGTVLQGLDQAVRGAVLTQTERMGMYGACYRRVLIGTPTTLDHNCPITKEMSPQYEALARRMVRHLKHFIGHIPSKTGASQRPLITILNREAHEQRTIANMDEVLQWFSEWGLACQVVDTSKKLGMIQVAQFMENTTLLFAVHGSGLGNAVLLPKGAVVVMLQPTKRFSYFPSFFRFLVERLHGPDNFLWFDYTDDVQQIRVDRQVLQPFVARALQLGIHKNMRVTWNVK